MPDNKVKTQQPKRRRRRNRNRRNNKQQPGNASRVIAPVSTTSVVKTGNPNVSSSGKSTRVRHREYVQDITAPNSAFAVFQLPINPGNNGTFPWLSSQAIRYESYLFHKLHFIYEPMVNTSVNGSLMLAVDFDAADTVPPNKTAMMANQSAVRTNVWNTVRYAAREKNLSKFGVQRYTRGSVRPPNTDIKTYDVGNLLYAYVGTPSTSTTLGELYVEYDVELFTPQIESTSTVAQQPTQTTVLSFTNGIPSLIALVSGSNSPLMWILDSTPGFVQLAWNLTGYTQWFVNMRGSLTSGTLQQPPWQFFQNAKPNFPGSAGTEFSPFELARLSDSAGGQYTSFNNSFTCNYVLSGDAEVPRPGFPERFARSFTAWPTVFRTNTLATGTMNIGILASATGDLPVTQVPFGDAGVDFAGFQIPIPQLAASRTARGGTLTRVTVGSTENVFYTNKVDFEEHIALLGKKK